MTLNSSSFKSTILTNSKTDTITDPPRFTPSATDVKWCTYEIVCSMR